MHHFADKENDIVINDIKFGYSEHINLAKKIIGFGTKISFDYIKQNYNDRIKHILPDIRNIYSIQHINDKNKNHRRKSSSNSNNSTDHSANSLNNNIYDIQELMKELDEDNFGEKENNVKFDYGKKEEKIKEETNKKIIYENKNINKLIDGLLKRNLFFRKFEKFETGKLLLHQLENDFCKKMFNKSKDNEINNIINSFF